MFSSLCDRAPVQMRALPVAAAVGTDHCSSALPVIPRASTSDSRSTTASCFEPVPKRTSSTTLSGYPRCQVRFPLVPFQDCTRPESVTLRMARLPGRSKRTVPPVDAMRRQVMVPSFSSTEATTPDAEATKTRSGASAE